MMKSNMVLTSEKLAAFEAEYQGPCLSLYQETHRSSPDSKQDPLRFRNLVKNAKIVLQEKYPEVDHQKFFEPLLALADDSFFWAQNQDGLAVLRHLDQFQIFRLQRAVPELVVVDSYFYLTPLRRYLQSVDRFQILGLSLDKIQFFEGNRNSVDEITAEPGLEITRSSLLGDELTEPEKAVSSHGGIGHGTIPTRHGYSDKQNDKDIDTEKYFRAVDKAVFELYSQSSKLPLMLACLPEHQKLFHKISSNPYLMTLRFDQDPEFLQLSDLRERAWALFAPYQSEQMLRLTDDYLAAKAKGHGSEDLETVMQAAKAGRVALLLLGSDQAAASGMEKFEDLTEVVEKMGGMVVVMTEDKMPGKSGVAALFRY